jgi:single-stranded DNA-binding protein
MISINEVHLVGFLAADPSTTATAKQVPIANLILATVSHKSKDSAGNKATKYTHHSVVCYGKHVELVKDLKKGTWLQVLGYLDSHTPPDKQTRQEIRVKTLNVLGQFPTTALPDTA